MEHRTHHRGKRGREAAQLLRSLTLVELRLAPPARLGLVRREAVPVGRGGLKGLHHMRRRLRAGRPLRQLPGLEHILVSHDMH